MIALPPSRHQLAVCPRISPADLARGASAMLTDTGESLAATQHAIQREFGAVSCLLTDSGTSALVLALRLMVGKGGTVALPGFGCVDLASAVEFAEVGVRLYDVDPFTMSPDLGSVESAIRRGVDAVLVAHYYGYPADVRGVRELATSYGVPVIEDAAQAAGGSRGGVRLGALGDLSILSFGRGKGLFGGRGGALLGFSREWGSRIAAIRELSSRRGLRDVAIGAAQWLLGRPRLYGLPASIPWLHLGEMVYHPAHEPQSLSVAAATLVRSSLANEARDLATRRRNAAVLRAVTERDGHRITPVRPLPRAESGFLRFAVLDRSLTREAAPRLGVMRGYPQTLHEQIPLRRHLLHGEPATPGAMQLRASLFTLPTHAMVTERDLSVLGGWLRKAAHSSYSSLWPRRNDASVENTFVGPGTPELAGGTERSAGPHRVPASCDCDGDAIPLAAMNATDHQNLR